MIAYLLLLVLVACERMVEIRRSNRNVVWAMERGGIEIGQRHFRVMTAVHALFLPTCALEVWLFGRPWVPVLGVSMLAVALLAQALRWWAITTLGPRWNVRTVVVPGEPVVTGGPYRFVRHPNYVAVSLEFMVIPLIHTAWLTAGLFSLVNLPLLAIRIRSEERLLAEHNDYGQLAGVPRFLPLGAKPPAAQEKNR